MSCKDDTGTDTAGYSTQPPCKLSGGAACPRTTSMGQRLESPPRPIQWCAHKRSHWGSFTAAGTTKGHVDMDGGAHWDLKGLKHTAESSIPGLADNRKGKCGSGVGHCGFVVRESTLGRSGRLTVSEPLNPALMISNS